MAESKAESTTKSLSIFEAVGKKEYQEALNNLLKGNTPAKEIRQRDGRGGTEVNYVNVYYMTRQISLLTGFKWKSECVEERAYPDWEKPDEIGARMKVTIWDSAGNEISHTSWGQKDVARFSKGEKAGKPLSIFDDLKAAYSDGIKKCLSYFGIASDVYGGKEGEFYASDAEGNAQIQVDSNAKLFSKKLTKYHILASEVFKILGIAKLSDIPDYISAWETVKKERGITE